METSDEHEQQIVDKLENIQKREIEALRRAGVAKVKEQGLEIESTESVRLFREARGYLLRLRGLREDLQVELQNADYYHAERVIGHIDDYNRILKTIKENKSFKNCVSSYSLLTYEVGGDYYVNIEGRTGRFSAEYSPRHQPTSNNVPMDGTTTVETFIYPRLIRLTKDLEDSIIGRCASGK